MADADEQMGRRFGVSVATVVLLRAQRLDEGLHWTRESGNRISYTEAGAVELGRLLGCKKKEGAGPEEVKKRRDAAPNRLTILALLPNPTAVVVRTPEHTKATVRVRGNKTLRRGGALLCLQTPGGWICVHPGLAPRT